MPRSSWKGHLRLSLVSVPVQAFTANVSGGGDIHFHQLHERCHSRIRYKKVCPVHGEVPNTEIVSGYEYAKGKYVIVGADELDQVRSPGDRAINIDTFVAPETIDPLYFDGRGYYLAPDGELGQKPYSVLCKAMEKQKRVAVARGFFSGREQLMLVRPIEHVLTVTMLKYESQVRGLDTVQDQVRQSEVSAVELKLAETLIEASTVKHFDYSEYEDDYTEKLTELIQAKVEGKEIVAVGEDADAPVINLMDALRRSVARKKQTAPPRSAKAPKKAPRKRHRA